MSDSYALWQHLSEIQKAIETLTRKVEAMAVEVEALKAEVARNTTVTQSAITLLKGLADAFEAAKGDPAAVQAEVDKLRANTTSLADAVTANTPTPAGG